MKDRLVWAEVNTSLYRQNLKLLRSYLSPSTKLMVILKANAYGHGAVELAKVAQQEKADFFGVACLYEARQLRNAGITLPILILNYIDAEGAIAAADLNCSVTVMDVEVLQTLDEYGKKTGKKPKIHVKIDTGLHRAGVMPDEALSLLRKVVSSRSVEFEGLFTHFATADEDDPTFTLRQIEVFESVLSKMDEEGFSRPPLIHACNSAAIFRFPQAHFSMVRSGIATYGLSPSGSPFTDNQNKVVDLQPILALKTQVIQLRTLQVGETVGYGRTFIATQPTRVALLPVGYGDGFRRALSSVGEVLIRGQKAQVIGRISMDQMSVDAMNIENVKVGDEVVLIGNQSGQHITTEEVALKVGTINYELMTGLAERVTRIYKK